MSARRAGPQGIAENTVVAKTGKGSDDWYALLDAWNGQDKGHTAMAKYLREEHGVSPWWAQSLTVRYEYARGLRPVPAMPDA